jgi:Flp pilus assembly protein TadD
MVAFKRTKGGRFRNCRRNRLLALTLGLTILGGCEPFPLHLDPLGVNGRDGGGMTPSYAALMRIGNAARSGGDYSNAVAVFRRAAEIEPVLPDPFVAIGDTLLALGSVDEAIVAYNSALARDQTCLPALQGLARAYAETGRPELALGPLNQALALSPENPKLLVLLGVVEDVEGRHSQAQLDYRRGLQRAPGDPALTVDLALSLALSGNYLNAIAALQPLATAASATAQERQTLALIYGLQGSVAEAARLGRVDLDEVAVEHNLAYYHTLRAMPPSERDRAIWSASVPPPTTDRS